MYIFRTQRIEYYCFIEAVQKLRTEVALYRCTRSGLYFRAIPGLSYKTYRRGCSRGKFVHFSRSEICCHTNNTVLQPGSFTVAQRYNTFIHNTEQHLPESLVGFFNFVEYHKGKFVFICLILIDKMLR